MHTIGEMWPELYRHRDGTPASKDVKEVDVRI